MKSCRCGALPSYRCEALPSGGKDNCVLPWGHDSDTHNSGFKLWKDSEYEKDEKEKV